MLYFFNPIWLAAAAGIIVPVIIHLWNIRQGKVLRVGSTMLLSNATQKSSSSLKISQWLLLLLRCLLIIVLAMLLAGPRWKTNSKDTGKGWVLIDKAALNNVYTAFKPRIDSLLVAGFELHSFSKGFERLSLSDSTTTRALTNSSNASSRDSITDLSSGWQLISMLDAKLPAGYPVYAFSTPMPINGISTINGMGGYARPAVSIDLNWQNTAPDTTTLRQSLYTRQQPDGMYRNTILQTNNNATWFAKDLSLKPPEGIPADTITKLITIFHDKNPGDAKYLEAALNAITNFNRQKAIITITQQATSIVNRQAWIFWLSDEEPPAGITSMGANIMIYASAGSPASNYTSRISGGDGPIEVNAIRTFKTLSGKADSSDSIAWQDAFGNTLLAKQYLPSNTWKLYTRFDPAWSDLTWSAGFPAMLAALMTSSDERTAAFRVDKRTIGNEAAVPSFVLNTYKEEREATGTTNLERLCWVLVFLVFTMERIISLRQKPVNIR